MANVYDPLFNVDSESGDNLEIFHLPSVDIDMPDVDNTYDLGNGANINYDIVDVEMQDVGDTIESEPNIVDTEMIDTQYNEEDGESVNGGEVVVGEVVDGGAVGGEVIDKDIKKEIKKEIQSKRKIRKWKIQEDSEIFKFITTIDQRLYNKDGIHFCTDPIDGIVYYIPRIPKSRIFDYYTINDTKDIKLIYDESNKYKGFKVFYCDLCSLTKEDAVFSANPNPRHQKQGEVINIHPEENYASNKQEILRITTNNIKFRITPTFPQYYKNHCLLTTQNHISSIQLLFQPEYFKGLYECLHYKDDQDFIKCIINGRFGSNRYHAHGHLTNQNIEFGVSLEQIHKSITEKDYGHIRTSSSHIIYSNDIDKLYELSLGRSTLYLNPEYYVTFILFKIQDVYFYLIQVSTSEMQTSLNQKISGYFLMPGRSINVTDYVNDKKFTINDLKYMSHLAKSSLLSSNQIWELSKNNNNIRTQQLLYDYIVEQTKTHFLYEYYEILHIVDVYLPTTKNMSESQIKESIQKMINDCSSIVINLNSQNNNDAIINIISLYITKLLIYMGKYIKNKDRLINEFILSIQQNDNWIRRYITDIELSKLYPLINSVDTLYITKMLNRVFNSATINTSLTQHMRLQSRKQIGAPSAFGRNYIFSIKNNNMLFKFVDVSLNPRETINENRQRRENLYHEAKVGLEINALSKYTPNFVKTFGFIKCNCRTESRQSTPVDRCVQQEHLVCTNNDNPFPYDIIVQQYIQNANSLYDYIAKFTNVNANQLVSIIKQVFVSLSIAQNNMEYIHTDLHGNNIIIQKCKNKYYKYEYPNKKVVYNYGVHAYLIDFGYSSTKNLKSDVEYYDSKKGFNRYFDFYTVISCILQYFIDVHYESIQAESPVHTRFLRMLDKLARPFDNYFNRLYSSAQLMIVPGVQNTRGVQKLSDLFLNMRGDPNTILTNVSKLNLVYQGKNDQWFQYLRKDFDYDDFYDFTKIEPNYFIDVLFRYYPEPQVKPDQVCEWGYNHYYQNGCFKFQDEQEKAHNLELNRNLIVKFETEITS